MPGPAKRKRHELRAESEDPDANEDGDREAALQAMQGDSEMKKPPKKKARCDDIGKAEAGQQLEGSTGDLEQPNLKNPVKRKRGRPPKSAEEKAAVPVVASGSPPFNASVFVSVEQPPQLVRGKTHRSDKHVAQEPRVAGPFTLVRLMKWAEFLDEIAECVGVDKENLQVNGLSWGFQKQKAQLPLMSEEAFKTLREQVKMKNGAATVIFVYHPICKKQQGQAGQAGHRQGHDNVNDQAVVDGGESLWGKKVGFRINCHIILVLMDSLTLSFSLASMTSLRPSSLSLKECMTLGDVQSTPTFTALVLPSIQMRPGTLNSTHQDYLYGPTQL